MLRRSQYWRSPVGNGGFALDVGPEGRGLHCWAGCDPAEREETGPGGGFLSRLANAEASERGGSPITIARPAIPAPFFHPFSSERATLRPPVPLPLFLICIVLPNRKKKCAGPWRRPPPQPDRAGLHKTGQAGLGRPALRARPIAGWPGPAGRRTCGGTWPAARLPGSRARCRKSESAAELGLTGRRAMTRHRGAQAPGSITAPRGSSGRVRWVPRCAPGWDLFHPHEERMPTGLLLTSGWALLFSSLSFFLLHPHAYLSGTILFPLPLLHHCFFLGSFDIGQVSPPQRSFSPATTRHSLQRRASIRPRVLAAFLHHHHHHSFRLPPLNLHSL